MTTSTQEMIVTPNRMKVAIENAKVVDDKKRLEVLPAHFGKFGSQFEQAIYNIAHHLSPDYKGGFWDYIDMGENGFFMLYSDDSKPLSVTNQGNYTEKLVDNVLFSLVVNSYVFSHLSCYYYEENNKALSAKHSDCFHALRNWFFQTIDEISETGTDEEKAIAHQASSAYYLLID